MAKLKLREFNELSHSFEGRLQQTNECAQEYLDTFPNPILLIIVSELITYIAGSIVAVLLLLTFIDSSILLNIELFDRSLIWYLAIFTTLLATARANLTYHNIKSNAEATMKKVAQYTHYFVCIILSRVIYFECSCICLVVCCLFL